MRKRIGPNTDSQGAPLSVSVGGRLVHSKNNAKRPPPGKAFYRALVLSFSSINFIL